MSSETSKRNNLCLTSFPRWRPQACLSASPGRSGSTNFPGNGGRGLGASQQDTTGLALVASELNVIRLELLKEVPLADFPVPAPRWPRDWFALQL